VEFGEDYILHDASDKVYESAAAGLEGLPVREEVFRLEDDGNFYYEKRQGFEGKKLDKKFHTVGKYTINKNVITLEWNDTIKNFTPELVKKYPSLIYDKGTLKSSTDKYLVFC